MKCPRLTKLLELMEVEYIEPYDDFSIPRIVIDSDSVFADIFLDINTLVAPNVFYDLYFKLKNNFVKTGLGNGCNIYPTFKNNQFTATMIEDYYRSMVDIYVESKPRYVILKSFQTSFTDNSITLWVGDEKEKEMVLALINNIAKGFQKVGINFINIEVKVGDFITPINKEIMLSMEAYNEQQQRELEQLANKEEINTKKPDYTNGKKPRKMSSRINEKPIAIGGLPTVEHEVVTWIQKNNDGNVVVQGVITASELKKMRNDLTLFTGTLKDKTGSIIVKGFINNNNKPLLDYFKQEAGVGREFKVYGLLEYDTYSRDVVIKFREVMGFGPAERTIKLDNYYRKRVELHAHTKMTILDSTLDVKSYVDRAIQYGHHSLAITDRNNVQALPELDKYISSLKKSNPNLKLKPIYGIEGNLVNEKGFNIAFTKKDVLLKDATYVVYDLETTGISSNYTEIIEIAACKVHNGAIIDEFSTFVNPRRNIPDKIVEITSITNDDVRGAPYIEEAMANFRAFFQDCILVAQNASFDNSHLYRNLKKIGYDDIEIPTIDTLQLARIRYATKLKKFNLESLCKLFGVVLDNHHRAIYDARATAQVFIKMYWDLLNDGITNYNDINTLIDDNEAFKHVFPTHVTLLAKNREGLVNINRIVSQSHTEHFYREPRILKKYLNEHREGIYVGSACYNGEVFQIAMNRSYEELLEVIPFYDYIEVQPVEVYSHLIESSAGEISEESLKEIIKKIIKAADEKGVMVVATGDVHTLDPEDTVFIKMLINKPMVGGGFHELHNIKNLPNQHFRTTDEMLHDFSFLGEEKAMEIVVDNTNIISEEIEEFDLFPKKLFSPGDDFYKEHGVPSVKEAVRKQTYEHAHMYYGNPLPQIIVDRLEKELSGILDNGYAPVYYISYLLVKHSRDAGYVVGSRGSVGSSLVANFMGITEVNALAPHYYCPKCHFSSFKLSHDQKQKYPQTSKQLLFEEELQSVNSGYDLPIRTCPECGEKLKSDGCGIAFETFMGFNGEKLPDIDLNFSGEYQAQAHDFCREVFGVKNTYRGGTTGKVAEQTAFGYVKHYFEGLGKIARLCEINEMVPKLIDIKRTTGQHPGGIIVVPDDIDINEITPVQYPADDTKSEWKTTHHQYHDFEKNLLKLDILGHDDPTMIRHLMNFVENDPENYPFQTVEDIPIEDPKLIEMFSSVAPFNVTPEQVLESIGTSGIPEFGTQTTKNMLAEIKPKRIDDLIKISGLSHGEGIWQDNARDFYLGLRQPKVDFQELIGCRDDIMAKLISKGIDAPIAFKIMEAVRKGKGLSKEQEQLLVQHNIEKWYIESMKIIVYLFPRAHATAYVIMALRIAWFKQYRPLQFYSGFFSKRAKEFDIIAMAGGYNALYQKIKELTEIDEKTNKKKGLSQKEGNLYTALLVALEMTARGFKFKQIDIEKSDALDFIIEGDDTLIIPFNAMPSLGDNIARTITDARNKNSFTSIKDVARRTKLTSTLVENLSRIGAFNDLPEEDQLGLFKVEDFK